MRWQKGRQLQRFNGTTYTYNANGIRTSKSIECEKHSYILNGTQILSESWGNNILIPLRDNEDEVCGIIYNENVYYFVKNLQNDIVAIFNEKSEQVAKYTYDAWGVPTIEYDLTDEKIATINPFRYRGYYYDTESGLYYLQSRYYDPKVGRFVNADVPEIIDLDSVGLDLNIFVYCLNEPVGKKDELGFYANSTWKFIKLLINNLIKTKLWKRIPGFGAYLFYKHVKNNGDWDYKCSNKRPSWAKSGYFYAFGYRMTVEQLGNFNFGFTGASMGFSPAILFAGGGYVAIRNKTTWKDWKYFFDSKSDHKWIALGIFAYSIFDRRYRALNSAYTKKKKKVAYTICLANYKYFKK